jgi:hypothetical protein
LPAKRELLKKVKAHADKKLGDVKVENALGGMRYTTATGVYKYWLTASKRSKSNGLGRISP